MNPQDQQLPKIKCSAKSLGQTRNSCAQKELQSHGVEDGLERDRLVTVKHSSIFWTSQMRKARGTRFL
jgi:hypothetical protein